MRLLVKARGAPTEGSLVELYGPDIKRGQWITVVQDDAMSRNAKEKSHGWTRRILLEGSACGRLACFDGLRHGPGGNAQRVLSILLSYGFLSCWMAPFMDPSPSYATSNGIRIGMQREHSGAGMRQGTVTMDPHWSLRALVYVRALIFGLAGFEKTHH